MMDLDKLKDAAANAADSVKKSSSGAADHVRDALRDEQRTDAGLDKAADAVNRATGGRFSDHVGKARDFADERLGEEYK